jgi:hypothetical protein
MRRHRRGRLPSTWVVAKPDFARRVFFWAGIYGLVVLLPFYFLEDRIGRDFPPAITHPENYYGFRGVALAWQLAFIVISRNPPRLRPVMLAAVAEKLLGATPVFVLLTAARVPGPSVVFAAIDLTLAVLFLLSYRAAVEPAGDAASAATKLWPRARMCGSKGESL